MVAVYKKISPILFGLALIPYFFLHGVYLRLWAMPIRFLYPPIGINVMNRLIRFWGVNFLRLGMIINNVRLETTGFVPEPEKPYLIISNHQSNIDIAVLFWISRNSISSLL